MRISGIQITDTYGCRDFKVGPFSLVRVTGQNGSGKSSILRALSYLFEGGTDPGVIRKGAEESVVRLEFDDGSFVVKTTRPKRARRGGEITGYVADLEWTQPDGTPRPAPQTAINELGSILAVDPGKLLRIDATTAAGRRVLIGELLKLARISFPREDVVRALTYYSNSAAWYAAKTNPDRPPPLGTGDVLAVQAAPEGPLDLDGLKKLTGSVTELRRRQGQVVSDTEGAIHRLELALPKAPVGQKEAQSDAPLRESLVDAQDYRRQVEAAISDAKLHEERQRAVRAAAAKEVYQREGVAINTEIEAKIKALEADRTTRIAAAHLALDTALAGIDTAARENVVTIDSQAAPELAKAITDETLAQTALEAHAGAMTLRKEIEVQTIAHRAAGWSYEQLSNVLDAIEDLRRERLKNLPITGLAVDDDAPCIDGIPWQHCNLLRRVVAILELATVLPRETPLLMWDDSEHADEENRIGIEGGLVEQGFQLVVARVTDDPELCIEVVQQPMAA